MLIRTVSTLLMRIAVLHVIYLMMMAVKVVFVPVVQDKYKIVLVKFACCENDLIR